MIVRAVEGEDNMVNLAATSCEVSLDTPELCDQLIVAGGMLRTSQVKSALPPIATVMEGRGLPNSDGLKEKQADACAFLPIPIILCPAVANQ